MNANVECTAEECECPSQLDAIWQSHTLLYRGFAALTLDLVAAGSSCSYSCSTALFSGAVAGQLKRRPSVGLA
jgi:hypothetical protein